MMKKFTSLLLCILVISAAFSSCGSPAPDFSNEYNPETDFNFGLEFHSSGRSRT